MINCHVFQILKELAHLGAFNYFSTVSTKELGIKAGMSQQSASRWLRILESQNLIVKEKCGRNIRVKITPLGRAYLKKAHFDFTMIFGNPHTVELRGEVMKGLGEGKYYIMKEGYRRQIVEKLFFEPFPGTLNVRVFPNYRDVIKDVREGDFIPLEGFEEDGRKFGRVRAYFATLNGYPSSLIIPEMSQYRDVVEVISDVKLREKFALKDGSEVELKVYL